MSRHTEDATGRVQSCPSWYVHIGIGVSKDAFSGECCPQIAPSPRSHKITYDET
jgi:hypothetical protein